MPGPAQLETAPEFNFGDDQNWVAGTEADPGRYVAEHTYAAPGDYTITARHSEAGEGSTTITVPDEPAPPAKPEITSIAPSDTVAQGDTITFTGTGFTDAVAATITGDPGTITLDAMTVASDTELTAAVPAAAAVGTYGAVTVTRGGTDYGLLVVTLAVTAAA